MAFLAPLIVWPANLGLVPWLALTAVQALLFTLAALPLPRFIALPGRPLHTAVWWVALEAVRGRAPLGGFQHMTKPLPQPPMRGGQRLDR